MVLRDGPSRSPYRAPSFVAALRSFVAALGSFVVALGSFVAALGSFVVAMPSRAGAECRIDDARAHLSDVTVSAVGTTFSLGLRGLPVQIRPDTGTPQARVDVLAPLRFTASYPAAELRYRTARRVDLYGGRIRLGEGAVPEWLGVRGNAIEASLDDLLQVRVKEPLRVPCSHVVLSDGKAPFAKPALLPPVAGRGAGTGDAEIALHLFPVAADPILLSFAGAYEIETRRPGWVLLNASWDDGSRVRGWTPEEGIVAQPGPLESHAESDASPAGCEPSPSASLTTFTVRRGAPVAAQPGGAPWARAVQKLSVQAFPIEREDGWVRIGAVGGLVSAACEEHEHLWVHASDLVWPERR